MSYYSLLTYALYVSIAASIVCSGIANANLHPAAKDPFRVFFWREQSDFSEKGWKFRQVSACFLYLSFALIPLSKIVQFFEAH
jgi:hypothetical protein